MVIFSLVAIANESEFTCVPGSYPPFNFLEKFGKKIEPESPSLKCPASGVWEGEGLKKVMSNSKAICAQYWLVRQTCATVETDLAYKNCMSIRFTDFDIKFDNYCKSH